MKRCRLASVALIAAAVLAAPAFAAAPVSLQVRFTAEPGNFLLANNHKAADLCVSDNDFNVVKIAAGLLAKDVDSVAGITPAIAHSADHLKNPAVLIGTLGHSPLIDTLVAAKKLDVSDIQGKWESFKLVILQNPLPNVPRALVIVGSDRRGTAYGVFDLSERIGVSPWHWWADVPPRKHDTLAITAGSLEEGPPSVKYRGIFINDEDWGLEPWAAKTFDPKQGNIGPKTYEKVFELLLRLKANYLWPAMHPVSTEFGKIAENPVLANKWAIVMGASHTEAMNRNNVDWPKLHRGPWNFATNRQALNDYWAQWAKKRGKYEAVWTVGIRGVHDSSMQGPKDIGARVKIVEDAIADQRKLLEQYVNPDITKVPQLFAPYKEVLSLYQHGMKVPDDVTILWTDDNYGYIRQLSNDAEQKRAGGSGIYYHLSYLGDPRSYTWLDTTPPALIWEEMTKAYAYNARRIWVLNVGDIKPGEIGIDFWTHLAWNIHAYDQNTLPNYLRDFATRTFGPEHADEIANILSQYYLLGFQRKPEAMDAEPFSLTNYDEAQDRLAAYHAIAEHAEQISDQLPPDQRDAFFELVLYPVRAAALANETYIDNALAKENSAESSQYAAAAARALQQIHAATEYYNTQIASGKWNHIMTEKGTTSKRWGFSWPMLPEAGGTHPDAMDAPSTIAASQMPTSSTFTEQQGVVSMNAGDFTRHSAIHEASWTAIRGLGRTGKAITVLPFPLSAFSTQHSEFLSAPSADYDFTTSSSGDATLTVYALPTHRTHDPMELRFAVAIDKEKPQILNVSGDGGDEHSKKWRENVLRNAAILQTKLNLAAPGKHTLHVWMVDPGVVLDKFVINLGGEKPSYLGPPETPQ